MNNPFAANTNKRLFIFLAALGIIILLGELLHYFGYVRFFSSSWFHEIYWILNPVQLRFKLLDHLLFRYDSVSVHTLNIACGLLMLLSAFMYRNNPNGSHALSRFLLSMIFITQFTYTFSVVIGIAIGNINYNLIFLGSTLLKTTVYLLLTAAAIRVLNSSKPLDFEMIKNNKDVIFEAPSTAERFLHYTVDVIVCALLLTHLSATIARFLKAFHAEYTWLSSNTTLAFALTLIPYYLISEYFLNSTPGKFLTRSRLITEQGTQPKFTTILIRTLSRKIPLEAFTFFTDKGLHDTLSSTIVVKEKVNEVASATAGENIDTSPERIIVKTVKQEIDQWSDFVKVNRSRRIKDEEIRTRLVRAGVSAEAIEYMLSRK